MGCHEQEMSGQRSLATQRWRALLADKMNLILVSILCSVLIGGICWLLNSTAFLGGRGIAFTF